VPAATPAPRAAAAVLEDLLEREQVDEELRQRIALAILESGKRHDLDPLLLASIMVVESRGNPFAVSHAGSMGIMQIHLPTWGPVVDQEGINLFDIEDNVDLGARILKGYIGKDGIWDAVARYKGRYATPESWESAAAYVRRVQRVYGLNPDPAEVSLD
jgi:soluble lytic murein transglycosylase-like protein